MLSGHFDPNRDTMFNPEALRTPAPFTFGNGPRTYGALRRFAYLNEDISLIKRTSVNERISVEFRADFLNIFNRTVFGLGTGGDQYGSSLNHLVDQPIELSARDPVWVEDQLLSCESQQSLADTCSRHSSLITRHCF